MIDLLKVTRRIRWINHFSLPVRECKPHFNRVRDKDGAAKPADASSHGKPADIVYRVNFPNASRNQDFQQLMQDAGWSLAATTVGWHYWRTEALAGKTPELFSDNASKAGKFRDRLAIFVGSATPLFLMLLLTDKQRVLDQLSLPFLVPLCVVLALYALIMPYTILRLMLRIRQLNNPLPS